MNSKLISKFYFWTVASIFVGGMLASAWSLQAFFPFYPWTMYAGAVSGDNLRTFKSYCIDKSGNEFAVTELDLWYQESNYYFEIEDLLMAPLPFTAEQKINCQKGMSSFARDLRPYCSKLAVYRLYWKKFVGPEVHNPTEKVLVCEIEVGHAGEP